MDHTLAVSHEIATARVWSIPAYRAASRARAAPVPVAPVMWQVATAAAGAAAAAASST
jgi:hypothetical protein